MTLWVIIIIIIAFIMVAIMRSKKGSKYVSGPSATSAKPSKRKPPEVGSQGSIKKSPVRSDFGTSGASGKSKTSSPKVSKKSSQKYGDDDDDTLRLKNAQAYSPAGKLPPSKGDEDKKTWTCR